MDRLTERIDQLTPLQRAAYALKEMQTRLEALEQARTEPIAIVGMACRFPGGADSPRAFWRLLRAGVDAIGEVPADRWDVDGFYDATPGTPGKTNTRWGGFLDGVDRFDPEFFGISPREALKMDPQQRMLLELAWEALEDAGLPPARLPGARTGVYVGIISNDYAHILSDDLLNFDAYAGTGNSHCIASNRLSYLLDLHGPSVSLDTACSSSLVGIHLACQSLRSGELDLALAGGVNLMLCPETTVTLSQAWMLSPRGRCRTFDAAADGYVRSEGGGVVVLKRLRDALADGDPIWAVIRGSAVNQDGKSNGLTAPNGPAQEAVIAAALADAGVAPSEVDYVETHGTGTPLGDPIEVQALLAVMGAGRSPDRPLRIGSVKTNIGHLEAGAGMAGLIKTVLALKYEQIPPHLHLETINPLLVPEGHAIEIPTTLCAWPRTTAPRRAGLSSFGFGGTNAHAILEEAPRRPDAEAPRGDRPRHVLSLSARSAEALVALVDRYQESMSDDPSASLADLAYSANTGRTHFEHRIAVVGESTAEVARHLQAQRSGGHPGAVKAGVVDGKGTPAIAFLFTGQGSQYVGMGRALFDSQPTFREALLRCDETLRPVLDRPLLSVLYPEPGAASPLDQTGYTQPALFALEYALAELWRSWGVEPGAVMGHSVGEYVAACVAGAMSLDDGLGLIAERARQMQALPAGGAMAAVRGSQEQVAQAVARFDGRVAIAAWNGPDNVVISGPQRDVEAAVAMLADEGVTSQRLATSHAFHSPLLEPMLDGLETAARSVVFSSPRIALISNLTGLPAENGTLAEPNYWRRHAREPVRFADGMNALVDRGFDVFVEIGPSPILLGMGRRCLPEGRGAWLPSLRKGRDDWQTLLETLATLYTLGVDVDWRAFDRDYQRRRIPLPTYPFQRRRFRVGEPRRSRSAVEVATVEERGSGHPLLGRRVPLPIAEVVFEANRSADRSTHPGDDRLPDRTELPASALWEMALAAAPAIGPGPWMIEDVSLPTPLFLSPARPRRLQTVLSPEGGGRAGFRIVSQDGDEAGWTTHATGRLHATPEPADDDLGRTVDVAAIRSRLQADSADGIVPERKGDWIEAQWEGQGERLARIRAVAERDRPGSEELPPGWLDCGVQLLSATLFGETSNARGPVPVGVRQLRIHGTVEGETWCHALLESVEGEKGTGDVLWFDDSGRLLAKLEGLTIERAGPHALAGEERKSDPDWTYELRWEPEPRERSANVDATATEGLWLLAGGRPKLVDALTEALAARGQRCRTVEPGSAPATTRRTLAEAAVEGTPLRAVVYAGCLEASDPGLAESREQSCGAVLDLIHALEEAGLKGPPRLWLLSRGAQPIGSEEPVAIAQTPLWGLGRVVAVEHPELATSLVDLDPAETSPRADADTIVDALLRNDREDQVAYRGGQRYLARLTRTGGRGPAALDVPDGVPFHLEVAARGALDSLMLRPVKRRRPGKHEVEIRVGATGLSFRDVLSALGRYPGDTGLLGGECAGEIASVGQGVEGLSVGDAVVALAPGSFGSYVTTRASLVVPRPTHLDVAQAASIPIAFVTAHRALDLLAGVSAGDRVLIHAATGGVGLAAVQVAQKAGAVVFATAGTPEKREYLRSLGVEHVFDSRRLDFADEIRARLADGEGLQVVLNSLTGESIARSLALLAPGGRFLELGKTEILDRETVDRLAPGVSYIPIALDRMMVEEPETVAMLLRSVMARFVAGTLTPSPHRVFPIDRAIEAFRLVARGGHVGKVVVETKPSAPAPHGHAGFRADGTYLVTGGLGGLGLRVARWLVDHGARHLVLSGRSGASGAAEEAVKGLEALGAEVMVARCDVGRFEEVESLFSEIDRTRPPLAGIFHLAGVLDDGVLRQQTRERFERVMAPKATGAWNLHVLSKDRPLDLFVLFSSAAALVGSPGQANYAAANAFLDGLAHHRTALGLPALSVNWGNWSEVGMAAALEKTEGKRWAASGMGWIEPGPGLTTLGHLLDSGTVQAGVLPVDWPRFFQRIPAGAEPPWLSEMAREAWTEAVPAARSPLLDQLDAVTAGERLDVLTAFVRQRAAAVLGVDPASGPDLRRPLNELGLDSLMAVELCNSLGRALDHHLPPTLLFDYPTLDSLIEHIAGDILLIGTQAPQEGEPGPDDAIRSQALAEVEGLSEEEMDALVAQELAKLVK